MLKSINTTSFTTLLLYIAYSAVSRFQPTDLWYNIILAFLVINILLIAYLILRDSKENKQLTTGKYWLHVAFGLLGSIAMILLIVYR